MINGNVQSFETTLNPLCNRVVRFRYSFIHWSRVAARWSLLLKSDWGNHAETTDHGEEDHSPVSSWYLLLTSDGETMPRQQTWKMGVASWCLLLTSYWATAPRQQTRRIGVSLGNNNWAVCNINKSVGGLVRWSHATVLKTQNLKFQIIRTNARWVPGAYTHKHKEQTFLDASQYAWVCVCY
jgi:hypothetical protein